MISMQSNEEINEFYRLMQQSSEKNKNKLTIPLNIIKQIYSEIFKSQYYQSVSDWSRLLPVLEDMEKKGIIRLPIGNNSYIMYQRVRFPKYIVLVRKKDISDEKSWRTHQWHPKLSWIPSLESITTVTLQRLLEIDEFLKKQPPNIVPITEKERSLQIFGDEKELTKLASSLKLNQSPDIFEITVCFPTFEPLIGFYFQKSSHQRVIFIENRDTFLSISKVCLILDDPPFYAVYYGQGLNFKTSVLSIPFEIEKGVQIEYFGDIDPVGFFIPIEAKKILQNIAPKYDLIWSKYLYERLIDLHIAGHYRFMSKDKRIIKDIDLNFLPPEKREYVKGLFKNFERIPQELLNLNEIYYIYSNDPIPQELYRPHRELLEYLYKHQIHSMLSQKVHS